MTTTPLARVPDATTRLGTDPVGPLLLRSCAQTTAAVGVYGVYALTNAWFVGHGVGDASMAAVNLAAPLLLLLGAVSTTVGAGGASLISRALGMGDQEAAARAAGNSFTLFWLCASVTTALGLIFLGPLLTLLGVHGELRETARPYAVILLCGALLSTGFSSLVCAEGRTGYATLLWLVAVAVQITLDPLLIFGLGMGVRGAALGTVGGQAVSAAMSLWFFFRRSGRPYRVRARDLLPHGPTLRALLGVGLPSFLAGTGVTLLAVVVNSTLAATVRPPPWPRTPSAPAFRPSRRCRAPASARVCSPSSATTPAVPCLSAPGAPATSRSSPPLYGLLSAAALVLSARPLAALFLHDAGAVTTAAQALRVIALGLAVAGITPLVAAYAQALGRPARLPGNRRHPPRDQDPPRRRPGPARPVRHLDCPHPWRTDHRGRRPAPAPTPRQHETADGREVMNA
ncbi:MATE family efflux transporter [Streptomyces sp. NPDC059371]|uniref:MATE family efflux transporter n=1 Tax=Streptomyces sp. NPDC059371 TaxID=3346812 RepID=UPI00369181F8